MTEYLSEDAVDRRIAYVIKYERNSDMYRKFACVAAAPVVGMYDGATAQMARALGCSPDTIENYAHAMWLYKDLRSNGHREASRKLWREMRASHWWYAWRIQQDGYESFRYLCQAREHGWSVEDMMRNYKAERDEGTAPLQRTRQILALRGLAGELIEHPQGLNNRQIDAARELLAAFEVTG